MCLEGEAVRTGFRDRGDGVLGELEGRWPCCVGKVGVLEHLEDNIVVQSLHDLDQRLLRRCERGATRRDIKGAQGAEMIDDLHDGDTERFGWSKRSGRENYTRACARETRICRWSSCSKARRTDTAGGGLNLSRRWNEASLEDVDVFMEAAAVDDIWAFFLGDLTPSRPPWDGGPCACGSFGNTCLCHFDKKIGFGHGSGRTEGRSTMINAGTSGAACRNTGENQTASGTCRDTGRR
jgi:hypothetical protein